MPNEDEIIEDNIVEEQDDYVVDEDSLDDDIETDEESDEETDEESDESSKKEDDDEYDDIFKEEEEFNEETHLEGFEDLEYFEENKEGVTQIAKKFSEMGVPKTALKSVVDEIITQVAGIEESYAKPIGKEDFQKLNVETRTGFKKLNEEIKASLSKEEREIFMRTFNNEEKIALALKLFGKGNPTGKTDYSKGGRKLEDNISFGEFSRRVTGITKQFLGKPEMETKAMKRLYNEVKNTMDKDIQEYLKDNPLG